MSLFSTWIPVASSRNIGSKLRQGGSFHQGRYSSHLRWRHSLTRTLLMNRHREYADETFASPVTIWTVVTFQRPNPSPPEKRLRTPVITISRTSLPNFLTTICFGYLHHSDSFPI